MFFTPKYLSFLFLGFALLCSIEMWPSVSLIKYIHTGFSILARTDFSVWHYWGTEALISHLCRRWKHSPSNLVCSLNTVFWAFVGWFPVLVFQMKNTSWKYLLLHSNNQDSHGVLHLSATVLKCTVRNIRMSHSADACLYDRDHHPQWRRRDSAVQWSLMLGLSSWLCPLLLSMWAVGFGLRFLLTGWSKHSREKLLVSQSVILQMLVGNNREMIHYET